MDNITNDQPTSPASPSCENCRYFVRYYTKYCHKFRSAQKGFCLHDRTKEIKNAERVSECGHWEPSEEMPDDRIRSVKRILERIDKSLKSLAEALSDEELLF